MQLTCQKCGEVIQASQINASKKLAKCTHCGAVNKMRVTKKKKVDIPTRIKITQMGDSLKIQYRWNRFMGSVGLVAAIAFNVFVGIVLMNEYSNTWLPKVQRGEITDSGFMSFPATVLCLSAIGIYLVMSALVHVLNTTTITVNREAIHIKQRPLPTRLDVKLASSTVEEIYTVEHIHKGSDDDNFSYQVCINTRDRKRKKLVDMLPEEEQARFIKRQIETFLGIEILPNRNHSHDA